MSIGDSSNNDFSKLNERSDINFAIKAAGLGTWEVNTASDLIQWDNRCRELFGVTEVNPLPYQEALKYIHHEDVEKVNKAIYRATKLGSDGNFDVSCRVTGVDDGILRWVRFIGRSYFDETGKVSRFAGVIQDVTSEIEYRQKVEQNEQRFRGLIQQAPFAMAVYSSRDLIIDIANPAMINVWGKTPSVVGTKLADALPELQGQPFIGLLEQVYDTGVAYQTNEQQVDLVVGGQLQSFWFNFIYDPLTNSENKVYAILNMAVDVTERVMVRQRIEESRRQLLSSFEQSPVAIATISAKDLVFTMANTFYAELVGRTQEHLIGKSLLDALPELRGQGFDDLLKRVIDTGTPYVAPEAQLEIIRNGKLETIYVDLHYQPQKDSNGKISGILVVATHITQQVTSRRMVEASEEKLRSVISNAPAAMVLFLGRDLIIDLHNQAFVDIVGKGPDIQGKPLREVMPELVGQQSLQILDDVFVSGKTLQRFGSQVDVLRNGAMTHDYYNTTYTPLFNESGEVYAILELAINVTSEILAKKRIEEAEKRLRGAIELAQLATWSLDIKSKKFTYSHRFMEWLGFSEDTKSLDEAYSPLPEDFRASVEAAIEDSIHPEASGFYENEHPIINRLTGQSRIIHAQAQVFYDAEGKPAILSGTAHDVTEQRKMQLALEHQVQIRTEELEASNEELAATNEELAATNEEFAATNEDLAEANNMLIRSNKNLEQFAYVASHDLQEPLRKIKQFGDLLKIQYNAPSSQALMYLERMQSAAGRMSVLIEDLLTFARISTQQEETEPVVLDDIILSVLSDLDLRIQETGAVIDAVPLPVIAGDRVQMGQLFQNLLSNALKFRNPDVQPHIQITSRTVDYKALHESVKPARWSAFYHLIEVADNGIGFDQKYADRIFQVFQRLHGRSEYAGTGIGLAICEKVVTNHGGAILATGISGKGATFGIYLPAGNDKLNKNNF
ncbi:PAS domain-containing protein [Dyadobacter psychrotolerans]|uniref:histidine kinase n=1 Tax=Dyadobacter psychrotolerans TaxID=2541721 RepID=A0A4R5DQF7_9BACT|nr:PAS domain-containing protein [Dyadobacter psychrotolerans]TDE14474.1 PAS domain S-box protein [Dyadobacter psychrotolerans]